MGSGDFTAKRYRERAVELRASADSMNDQDNRRVLRGIADNYDQMAKRLESAANEANHERTVRIAKNAAQIRAKLPAQIQTETLPDVG